MLVQLVKSGNNQHESAMPDGFSQPESTGDSGAAQHQPPRLLEANCGLLAPRRSTVMRWARGKAPPGTYTITLKAADTPANLSHSITVTLTVH
jgi:hypothetical protein